MGRASSQMRGFKRSALTGITYATGARHPLQGDHSDTTGARIRRKRTASSTDVTIPPPIQGNRPSGQFGPKCREVVPGRSQGPPVAAESHWLAKPGERVDAPADTGEQGGRHL